MTAHREWFPIDVRGREEKRHRIRIMTGQVARDGDVVEPLGMRVENYLRNPVVMWVHDYLGRSPSGGLPIGRTLALERHADGIEVEFEFLSDDPFAGRVQNAWEKGFLRTASIGWDSLETTPLGSGRGVRHTKTELLEWSLVPIPADPGASRELYLAGMRSLGYGDLLERNGEEGARNGDAHEAAPGALLKAAGPLPHPPLGHLVAELRDAWDYVKARVGDEGLRSARLRRYLSAIAGDMATMLERDKGQGMGSAGAKSWREDGDDTADEIQIDALLRAAEQLRELAKEASGFPTMEEAKAALRRAMPD